MRSLKATLMAVSTAAAVFCAATFAAQSKQDKPEKQEKDKPSASSASAKDIVVVDASSQLTQLKDQKSGAGKKLASAPINLSAATGYRQGLDLVAFRLSGTIDKADGKSTPAAENPAKEEGQPAAGGSEKGSGTVIVQAIVSPRPDLTYEEVMRIINKTPGGATPGSTPPKDGATPTPAPGTEAGTAAILCEVRTSSMTSGGKGRTFEVVGYAPAEGHTSPDMLGDIKRRLTETSASAAKADPGNPGATVGSVAAEPKPQDVKQALDLIEKGKAFLYINLLPEMSTGKTEHDMGAAGDAGGCTLKDISLVFAAVPKSAP
jgi:hypothetical protein